MADLESIIEFSIEFYKFHNVDLFQRGWVPYISVPLHFVQCRNSFRWSKTFLVQFKQKHAHFIHSLHAKTIKKIFRNENFFLTEKSVPRMALNDLDKMFHWNNWNFGVENPFNVCKTIRIEAVGLSFILANVRLSWGRLKSYSYWHDVDIVGKRLCDLRFGLYWANMKIQYLNILKKKRKKKVRMWVHSSAVNTD